MGKLFVTLFALACTRSQPHILIIPNFEHIKKSFYYG